MKPERWPSRLQKPATSPYPQPNQAHTILSYFFKFHLNTHTQVFSGHIFPPGYVAKAQHQFMISPGHMPNQRTCLDL